MFRRNLKVQILDKQIDQYGRYVYIRANINECSVQLLNIYAPNIESEQKVFYTKLTELLRAKKDGNVPLIIGGDFNVVLNPMKDKEGGRSITKTQIINIIQGIMQEFCLTDIWRSMNPYVEQYTWSQSEPDIKCRLDMWLIPTEAIQITEYCRIVPAIRSDHKAVICKIQGEKFVPRGPGIWKLNTSVLEEEEYKNGITTVIKEQQDYWEGADPRSIWLHIKDRIKDYSTKYCTKRAENRRQREKEVKQKLEHLESSLHELKTEEVEEYQKCKREYEKIYDYKAKGSIMRSKVRWATQGEKNTSYFLGLEKRNYNTSCITQLDVGDGVNIGDSREILDGIHSFYSNLYKEKRVQLENEYEDFFDQRKMPQIREQDSKYLEDPLKIE